MSKIKSKRKLNPQNGDGSMKKAKLAATVSGTLHDAEPKTLQSVGLHPDDLDLAIDTINTLAESPGIIKSKSCKELRTAIYNFRKACTTGLNSVNEGDFNLTARISGALADGGYADARVLLAEMRIRGQTPKLGSLCRWVRDLDVVSGLADQLSSDEHSRTSREEELLVVLDSILRLTGPTDYNADCSIITGPINVREHWDLRDGAAGLRVYDNVLDRSIFTSIPTNINSKFAVIETTPGSKRKPPNLHPAILYASKDDAIFLSSDPARQTTHHKHPIVPNLHLLKDVLSPEECTQIIAAAESAGFTPDAPIREDGEESSILAHNFYWIVDTSFCTKLWSRVERFVPQTVDGRKVRGVNRRFRVYRYVPGAEYRAHIDGAWPPSGIDPTTDKYIYDSSPPEAKQSSLYTFLIYLNDEFEAGETTFFLPSAREGCMNAYQVKPIQGSVVMFPHGETEGSLLHEGTGVRKESKPSAKYVIRTDVLYDIGSNSLET